MTATESIEYRITWSDVEKRAQRKLNIALAVDDEVDQRELVSLSLESMDMFLGNNEYFSAVTKLQPGVMAAETPLNSGIFVAETHEAGLHAALHLKEAGAAPTLLVYDINIMRGINPMNGIEAALDVVALTNGNAPVVFFTGYDPGTFEGFESAQQSRGVYYVVQKPEGVNRLKEVVREAQYCANVKTVLEEVKLEKEGYLARLRNEIGQALLDKIKGKKGEDLEEVATELEAICEKIGGYNTFAAEHVHKNMESALAVVETVKVSSSVHPLGDCAEEQSAVDQKITQFRENIDHIRYALRDERYGDVGALVNNAMDTSTASDLWYDMMSPTWGVGEVKGHVTVMGPYLFRRLVERAPGGLTLSSGASNLATMSYNQQRIEEIASGLQMLLVAGERALREVKAKESGNSIDVQVDTTSTNDKLYITLNFSGQDKPGLRDELEQQLGFKELGPRLLRMPYISGESRGNQPTYTPRIQAFYSNGDVGLSIRVELEQTSLTR